MGIIYRFLVIMNMKRYGDWLLYLEDMLNRDWSKEGINLRLS